MLVDGTVSIVSSAKKVKDKSNKREIKKIPKVDFFCNLKDTPGWTMRTKEQ